MLIMAFMLAIMSAAFELMIASQVPLWHKWSHKSKLFNLMNSMVLSYIIGIMFGAQGLIVMFAGVMSTFLTIPGYSMLAWNFDTPNATAKGGNVYKHTKSTIKPKIEKGKELAGDLVKVGYVTGKVITSPIWITRKAVRAYKAYKV
jgi:hypothetical protein